MDSNGRGKGSARVTSALVSAGGLLVALVTGGGLWLGHELSSTQAHTSTNTTQSDGTSSSAQSDAQTQTDTSTQSDSSVSQGGIGSSDATTTGS